MAEKRISVRLSAVGGRQVRAELEGIGAAGTQGFGRLSREMELANTRLASFARQAGIALAAMTVAAAAAGVAMVRSGLAAIDAQAKLAQSMQTTVESVQTLTWAGELAGVSMSEIEQATKKLTTRLSEAATGSGAAVQALARLNLTAADLQALPLDQRIVAIQEALGRFVPEAERAAVASDLFGDRAALAFLRIDPATLREAAQDVRDFGVAVSATDAAQIERTGDALARLSLIGLGLTNRLTAAVAPALEQVATLLADMARATGPIGIALTGLIDNLGRLGTYATTFAALLAGRWVAGLAAAALSVKGLATALVVLRGALIRTGIGAVVVAAGQLVYQFGRLVSATGGFGTAMGLVADVGLETWDRIKLAMVSLGFSVESAWQGIKAAVIMALAGALDSVVTFADRSVALFQGAFDAVKAIWGALPGAIGDFAFGAANALISGVEAMLNGVVTRINSFVTGLNAALALLPDWVTGGDPIALGQIDPLTLGRIDNPFAGQAEAAGAAAGEAFSAAMAESYVTAPDMALEAMAETARAAATMASDLAGDFWRGATAPMESLAALGAAMTSATDEMVAGAAAAEGATAGLNDELAEIAGGGAGSGGGGTAGAAADALDAVTEAAEAMAARARSGAQSVAEMLSGIVTGGKSALDVLGDLLMRLADVQIQRAIFGLNAGGIGTGFFGMLGAALTPPSFAGGGFTGSGPRTGGLDGQGGFMAMLHPQETVVDHMRGGASGRSGGGQPVTIHVDVTGANGDRQIMAMVEAGVSRGLAAYDRQLPGRVDGISRDRRAR